MTLQPALFIRRFRFLFAEFLEARIIPERIEHRIEPEQRRSKRHAFSQRASDGIESSFCKAAMARSGSPIRAATRARISIGTGPSSASFSIGIAAIAFLDESERGGLVTKAHIGQREIANEVIIFRLFFEKRFQLSARLSPGFLSGSVVAGNFLRPA